MTDEKPAESYSREEMDEIRARVRAALEAVDAAIAKRRIWYGGDSGPGWSPDR